jgi:hypothetical protein
MTKMEPKTKKDLSSKKRQMNEFTAVSQIKPFERYIHSIKKIANNLLAYTIKCGEDLYVAEVEANKLIFIWPSEYAANQFLLSNNDFTNCLVQEVSYDDIVENIERLVSNEKNLISVYSVGYKTGFVVTLTEFIRDINEEAKQYD